MSQTVPPPVSNLCLRCGRDCGARRKRGLCRRCHADPSIRSRYPHSPDGPLKHLGTQSPRSRDFDGPAPPPDQPTLTAPGSPARIAALQERARLGQALFHRGDPSLPLACQPNGKTNGGVKPWELSALWRLLIAADPSIGRHLKELAEEAAARVRPRPLGWAG